LDSGSAKGTGFTWSKEQDWAGVFRLTKTSNTSTIKPVEISLQIKKLMLRKISKIFLFLILGFITLTIAACAKPETAAEEVVLQTNWYHAPEFIGYYMADARGFYKESGLNVKILEGGPGIKACNRILDGKVDFAVATFDEQKTFIKDLKPSEAVMSVFQIPPLVMFSLADSGIKEPADMVGKKVGIKNSYWRNIARQTLTNAGIDPSGIIEVDVPVDAQAMLYNHEVDVWMGYAHDEPISARQAGYPIINIYPADYGVGGYEGLLLVNQTTLDTKSALIEKFVQASRKGLQYALEHPDLAAAEMIKWQPKHDLEFYKMAIRALIPLVDIPQTSVGGIDSKRWEQLLGEAYNPENIGFTMRFLK
jgi:NitT/TauT family transport system substrate-binding protein